MTATTNLLLHLRHRLRSLPHRNHHPSSFRLLSTSSDDPTTSQPDPKPEPETPKPTTKSPFASYFSDVKASLQNEPPQSPPRRPPSFSGAASTPPSPPPIASIQEIRKNLSEFRRRTAPPPSSSQPVSLQDLYKRNVLDKSDNPSSSGAAPSPTAKPPSFDTIKSTLLHLRSTAPKDTTSKSINPNSLARFRENLRMKPGDSNLQESSARATIIGGSEGLPSLILGKEKKEIFNEEPGLRSAFYKMYGYEELGQKLKLLRPEKKKGKWFSLHELNERLVKLREAEENAKTGKPGEGLFSDLRDSLSKIRTEDNQKMRKNTMQRLDILSEIGGTPSFMLQPPKDELVEKYFHPDNMSSAEKMKLELKKVRDEFKMSESDCGSARVQVAQLTTKIKHLSTALHKKDKHSRRGLQAMVQRRKKLLKYLRRTDWDSYCLVLSKLGLRDNPDYKA